MRNKTKRLTQLFTFIFYSIFLWSCGHTIGEPDPRIELIGDYEGICSVISGNNQGKEYPIALSLFTDEYFQSNESMFLNDGIDDIMIDIIDNNKDELTFIIFGSLRMDDFQNVYQYSGHVGFQILDGTQYHGKLVKNDNELTYFIETDYVNDDLDSLNAVYQIIAFKTDI